MRSKDLPVVPQLAVPVIVPEEMTRVAYADDYPKEREMGDLGVIEFYYLLRVDEYTKPRMTTHHGKRVRATRTVQFSVKDVGFFKNGIQLQRRSPLKILLTADRVTLKITNQKME